MSKSLIKFSEMTPIERQLFIDFQYKELNRHLEDIVQIRNDFQTAADKYGIKPRGVYVDTWIEVGE